MEGNKKNEQNFHISHSNNIQFHHINSSIGPEPEEQSAGKTQKADTGLLTELVKKDELQRAIAELNTHFQGESELTQLQVIEGRLNRLSELVRMDQITFEKESIERNKIRLAILELINLIQIPKG